MKIKIAIFHWLGIAAGAAMVALSAYACIEGGSAGLLTVPVAVFGGLGAWMAWLDMRSPDSVPHASKKRHNALHDDDTWTRHRRRRYGNRWSSGWSGRGW